MINDLIRSIVTERKETTEEELMVTGADNADIRDTFLDAESDEATEITEAEINSLISKIPESSADLSTEEISALAENFMELVTGEDIVFESSGKSLEDSIEEAEKKVSSLESKENPSEDDKKELTKAKGKLNFLKMVKDKKKGDDSDGEKAEEGAIDMHYFDGSDTSAYDPTAESLEDIADENTGDDTVTEKCSKESTELDDIEDLDDTATEAAADDKVNTEDTDLTEALDIEDDIFDGDFDEPLDIDPEDFEDDSEDNDDEDGDNDDDCPIDLDDIED